MLPFVFATPAMAADSQHRIRVTETSVTEQGGYSAWPTVRVQTKGYGLTYISPYQVGLTLTQLRTYSLDDEVAGGLTHRWCDISYTWGHTLIVTGGAGVGIGGSGSLQVRGIETKMDYQSGASAWLGPGFALGPIEIYWIRRHNWVRLKSGQGSLDSLHWQLGVGLHF